MKVTHGLVKADGEEFPQGTPLSDLPKGLQDVVPFIEVEDEEEPEPEPEEVEDDEDDEDE